MDFDKLFEPLKTATAETLPAALSAIKGQIADHVFQEKQASHDGARVQLYGTFKKQLQQTAPDAFEGLSEKAKYEDMLSTLGERLKAPKAKAEPQETADQMRARMQSEFDGKLKGERESMLFNSAFSEIESAAIANKLDPAYKGLFGGALRAELETELSPDSRVLFKNRADGKYFTKDGAHATPDVVAQELLKKYPRLMAAPVQSPTPPGQNGQDNLMPGVNKLREGLKELRSLQ